MAELTKTAWKMRRFGQYSVANRGRFSRLTLTLNLALTLALTLTLTLTRALSPQEASR